MQAAIQNKRPSIPQKEFAKRFHDHSHINTHEHASLFKTGVLDVQLLMDGQLTVPETLLDCSVVGVKFAAMTYNNVQHRNEPVFAVTDVSGQFQGHYFASAFKSLTL